MTEPCLTGPALRFCGGLMLEVRDPADVRSVVGEVPSMTFCTRIKTTAVRYQW
jgi:hypothetical protein